MVQRHYTRGKKNGATTRTSIEKKIPQKYSRYVAQMSHVNDSEPYTYEEVAQQQLWNDVMVEEYKSIINNCVWKFIPNSEGNSIVTFKCIYKIKHVVDASI